MGNFIRLSAVILILLNAAWTVAAQTTAFNYQGKLTDSGNAANGSFQMQFKLFDAVSGGSQIGATLADVPVTATNGIFAIKLDFGANALSGANRFLEIAVRRNAGESYTTLSPREQIASSPFAVRTLSAAQADVALDAQKLGGIAASEYVTNSSGGNSFIRNGTTPQSGSFNISGNGFFGGNVGIGTTTPLTKLHVLGYGIVETSTSSTTDRAVLSLNSTIGGANRVWTMENGLFGTAGLFGIFDRTAAQARLVINTNGNVGIGTGNPVASKFEVQDTTVGTAIFGNTTTAGSGVFGSSQNSGGYGVYGKNVSGGFAMYAEGSVGQSLGYGLPKAMVFVLANGTVSRCYNGVTGATTNGCGFGVTVSAPGLYDVNFGFTVNNRFLFVTASGGVSNPITCRIQGFSNSTTTLVKAFDTTTSNNIPSDFYLIVY